MPSVWLPEVSSVERKELARKERHWPDACAPQTLAGIVQCGKKGIPARSERFGSGNRKFVAREFDDLEASIRMLETIGVLSKEDRTCLANACSERYVRKV